MTTAGDSNVLDVIGYPDEFTAACVRENAGRFSHRCACLCPRRCAAKWTAVSSRLSPNVHREVIAVRLAQSFAHPGDAVLLSPGCASFGMFNNEFDRGEQFRQIVSSLAAGSSRAANGDVAPPAEPSVEELIRRLEQMGAVVVRLERQRGPAGNYLFRCELPLPQNPRYHRFFQAVDSQPVRAALRVTHEVEAWKAALRQ